MKKITALLLCFLLLCMCSTTSLAAETEDMETHAVISATVPDSHTLTITAEKATVFYKGISGVEVNVERLSEPRLLIRAESSKVIKSVTVNGMDVTDLIHGGYLELDPVYEDKVISVITEDEPVTSKDTYTVKGKVTMNGQPLADVDLELRSTLMVTRTDNDGNFVFNNVTPGVHSLTALKDGKVIGYLSFTLQKDSKADVILLDDGTYIVSVDQNSTGVELHLVLNMENGTLDITDVHTVPNSGSNVPQTGDTVNLSGWWILMIVSTTCIVVLETYRRKKKFD